MRLIQLIFLATSLTLGATSSWAARPYAPKLARILAAQVFAPTGFDDNDNAQLIVHGTLMNTCYKTVPTNFQVNREKHTITIQAQALVYRYDFCVAMDVPFTDVIDLGPLPSGQYKVYQQDAHENMIFLTTLPVVKATTTAPDDFVYAPVTTVRVNHSTTGVATAVLSGPLPSNCMNLDHVQLVNKDAHIVELLPILTISNPLNCKGFPVPFETTVSLPSLPAGDSLVYVRSLSGQSTSVVERF